MNRSLMLQALAAMALGAVVALTAGCNASPGSAGKITAGDRLDWTTTAQLALADSCGEAETFFRQAAITSMELQLDQNKGCFNGTGCYRWLADGGAETGAHNDAAQPAPKDDAVPDDYSQTTVQVEGVDEADFVKTDGQHVYALFGNDLVILKSWPAAETAELGRVGIKGSPSSFFLYGDQIAVLSWANYYDFLPAALRPDTNPGAYDFPYSGWWWRGATLVTLVDVTNVAAPAITAEHLVDGYALATRRIGGKVYLAQSSYEWIDGLQTWPENVAYDAPQDEVDAAFEGLRVKNIALIAATPLSHWLPNRYELGPDGTFDPATGVPVTACDAVYTPSVYSGQSVLSVLTLDLDATDPSHAITGSSIIGDWGTVYASTSSLFIGTTNWNYYWWWQDATTVQPLTTQIHQFAIGSDGVARYVASGSVLGYAINQYAFDEYDGHLRVATTNGFGWWNSGETTESRVTVLARQGSHLVTTGLVTGLGQGESIYAVRFLGPEGYVVTFRQTDPLYSIDLSDPTDPRVVGELKVSGYSSYLHPMDADHLLAIGRDASDTGQVQGLQFQIFDVSDPTQPIALHKTVIGDSWSTWSDAQWDPHAFVYYPSRGLLAVPVSGWEPNDAMGYWNYRSEVFIFAVGLDSGIQLVGGVSHVPLLEEFAVNTTCQSWYGWWEASVRRGIFIEDYLVTLSNLGFMVHDTRDLGAGPVASDLCIDPSDFNGGQPYYDPCNGEAGVGSASADPDKG